jgi:hypothetical protein
MVSSTFAFAGRASFVVENPKGESVTVKLSKSKPGKVNPSTGQPYPETFFVSLRHNNHPWVFVGKLDTTQTRIVPTKNAAGYWTSAEGQRAVAIAQWTLDMIHAGTDVPAGYRLAHTGRCGKCGKLLRDAESIALGLGPVCRG